MYTLTYTMKAYDAISIIYNPNSTGPSKQKAEDLAAVLRDSLATTPINTIPTGYAGHGEDLAYKLAKATPRPLIISSSGDGGYHEIVNGVMKANNEGANATTSLLPAGNANDHFNHLQNNDLIKRIVSGATDRIDLLLISAKGRNKGWQRYAHSYAGIGLTPHAGLHLNKARLNRFNEKVLVIKAFFTLQPITIKVRGEPRSYYSLVFSNVRRMAKIIKISNAASVKDGKFEIVSYEAKNKLVLVYLLFKSILNRLSPIQAARYSFATIGATSIQLDGEVYEVEGNTEVEIKVAPRALACIL